VGTWVYGLLGIPSDAFARDVGTIQEDAIVSVYDYGYMISNHLIAPRHAVGL
jgi:hypothetical protein